jgi:hypothetical protein
MVNEHETMKVVELPSVDNVIAVDQLLVMVTGLGQEEEESLNDDDGVNGVAQSLATVDGLVQLEESLNDDDGVNDVAQSLAMVNGLVQLVESLNDDDGVHGVAQSLAMVNGLVQLEESLSDDDGENDVDRLSVVEFLNVDDDVIETRLLVMVIVPE